MPNRKEEGLRHYESARMMRQVRNQIKRNRKPKRVRRKEWVSYNYDDPDALDELDLPNIERIVPRGEQERRRVNIDMALARGTEEEPSLEEVLPVENVQGHLGVVVEVSSGLCRVDLGGRLLLCSLRGSLSAEESGHTNVVAVGDEVHVSENGSGQGCVEFVLPRRSVLARPDVLYHHLQQIIVANADQLLIVASWREPHIWPELIDRYLITAQRYNLKPIICVNKVDLAENVDSYRSALQPYQELGFRVLFASALRGNGLPELRALLRGKTSVLAGLSGVGKSSLLAAVQPGLRLRIGEVSTQGGEGRHITTQVVLHRLEVGGFVADTPGIREFGLQNLQRNELARFYPEIARLSGQCHFDDCVHMHEPDCAVRAAVARGCISPTRYHNYQKIYQSLPG